MVILLTILHTIYFAEGRLLNVNAISKEVSPVQSEPAMFIADVIRSFNWTSLCILHDTSSGYTVASLHSAMASKTTSCKILDFNIDETDVNDVLKTVNVIMSPSINIEVDMVASGLTISDDRAAVMDYLLPPFITAYTRVMYREPDVDQYRWLLLLKPFKQMVFVVFGVCVVCVLLIYGVTELHLRHGTPGDTLKTKKEILSNMSWFILGSMLKQGSTYTFTGVSGRVLTFFRWIFLIVITSVYTGKLVAFLSVKKSEPPPFSNLQELSERLDYTIGFPTEGFARTYFQNSKREDIKQLWKMVQQQHVTDPRVFSTDYNYHVNEMKKGKYAAIVFTIISDVLMAKNCKLAYLRDWALYEQMAFGVPKSSPLKMHMLVDTGWPGKWMDEFGWLVDKTGCDSEKLVTPVTLDEVGGVGTAVAAGVGLGLLTLALECLYHYCIGSQYGNET
ncbi:glutamate receptor ionotropic, kainate 3-like [Haliotis rufescens]|uniref:glutamate receptor ionotropic, kainate 3-like n=1 Tax=Haliotis rufescens TaxID=6454 RepID=UPI00201ED2E9|nr:glutamate receptor ionotropic, kainate 3-like [Haliotis rufescens]